MKKKEVTRQLETGKDLAAETQPLYTAFLLSQIGAHSAFRYAELLAPLDLLPPHTGIMRMVAAKPALTQQALAAELGTLPSRLVVLLDDLEKKELIERRAHPSDRRSYALHLSAKGQAMMKEIFAIGAQHQKKLLKSLTAAEQKQLGELLQKVADEQQLIPNVHPAFKNLSRCKD